MSLANEFSFVLKDSEGKTLETVSNDASGNVKFSKLEFKKGQEGVHNLSLIHILRLMVQSNLIQSHMQL